MQLSYLKPMDSGMQYPNNEKRTPTVQPLIFVVWLLIVASVMLFAAFSSAYLVHRGDGVLNDAWKVFDLPIEFWISAGIVIVSSIFIQWAYVAAKKDDISLVPALITITLVCAIAFCISQVLGWQDMMKRNLFFSNQQADEISVSFVYVISGVHLVHIIFGIVLLIIGVVKASRLQIHKKNLLFITICKTYWHFLGILWIYLLLFLYFAK